MSDHAMFSMSSDLSALSSAIEPVEHSYDLPAEDDVTSCSQSDCVGALSDKDGHSEPSSPAQDGNSKTKSNKSPKKSPGLSYIALISMAIQSSPGKRMLLSEIYQWISDRYPYYNMKEKSWRNSIRHNLSLNECFVKNGRSENGKGNYWSIHPANIDDFSNGDFRRRRARRRVRKCDEDLKRLCTRSPYSSSPPSPSDNSGTSSEGYIPMASTKVPTSFLSSLGMDSKNHNEWNYHNFPYQTSTSYKPYDFNIYPGDVCSKYFQYQNSDSYNGLHTHGPNKHHATHPTTPPGELNVNVNVNVCGNAGSSHPYASPQSPSYYVPSCAQVSPLQTASFGDHVHPFPYNGYGTPSCMYNVPGQGLPLSNTEGTAHNKE